MTRRLEEWQQQYLWSPPIEHLIWGPHPRVGRRCRALENFNGPEHGLLLQYCPNSIPDTLYSIEVDVREELVDFQARCQSMLNCSSQGTLHGAVLLRRVGRSQLAADPETTTVLVKTPVRVFRTIIGPERARNSPMSTTTCFVTASMAGALLS